MFKSYLVYFKRVNFVIRNNICTLIGAGSILVISVSMSETEIQGLLWSAYNSVRGFLSHIYFI